MLRLNLKQRSAAQPGASNVAPESLVSTRPTHSELSLSPTSPIRPSRQRATPASHDIRAALLDVVKESTPEEQVAKVEEIAADKKSKASQPRQQATSGKAVTAADVKALKEEIRDRDAKIKTLKFQKQEAERREDESTRVGRRPQDRNRSPVPRHRKPQGGARSHPAKLHVQQRPLTLPIVSRHRLDGRYLSHPR